MNDIIQPRAINQKDFAEGSVKYKEVLETLEDPTLMDKVSFIEVCNYFDIDPLWSKNNSSSNYILYTT